VPWWSWVVIWVVLVLGLAGMLAWFALTLFRKMMRAADALGDLGDQLSQLEARRDELESRGFAPAIFADHAELVLDVELQRIEREHRRQERRDNAVSRGKLLAGKRLPSAPWNQRTGPHVW
jgi:hypothetical protein